MRHLAAALAAGAVTRACHELLQRLTPVAPALERTNFSGARVTLAEGPALVAGLLTGVAHGPAYAVAAGGAGAVGLFDDLAGSASSKGLRGHLRALRRGEVTTGTLKLGGLAATGIVAAILIDGRTGRPLRTTTGALLVATSANLANLFDLRPGRALKVSSLVAVPLAASGSIPAAVATGAGGAVVACDLRGRSMMGDTGANALGAMIGAALTERAGTRGRALALLVTVGLTLASEKVSFSQVIADTPVLRELDAWGRG